MDDEITIRHLGPDDLDLLVTVEPELFDGPVTRDRAAAFLADPQHELLVAFDGDHAVAKVTANVLLSPDKPPQMFVNEVDTRESHQRRGLARALMERMLEIGRARGCDGIWLATEADNLPAQALYRALRGEEMPALLYGWDGAFDPV